MGSRYGLTAENMGLALPDVLKNDQQTEALGATIAQALAGQSQQWERLALYAIIDQMPEELLDILAVDFKVDWWDSDYSVEEKRQTLKGSWAVHRTLGTKGAVERAISAIYEGTKVSEWFEYGGKPYHFKLLVDANYERVDTGKHRRVLERVKWYKNVRSVMDGIEYVASANGVCHTCVAVAVTGIEIRMKQEVTIYGLG